MGQNFGPPSSFLAKSQSLTWIIRKLSAKGWKSTINVIRTTIQISACTNRSKIPGILTSSIGISISIRITPQSVRKWPKNVLKFTFLFNVKNETFLSYFPLCSKSSLFVQKIQLWFPEKIVDFSGVKNSWKCFGFGLFSCWQLWFHEKNCQKKLGKKLR